MLGFPELPDTPFWKGFALVVVGWILICAFFPLIFALLCWGAVIGVGALFAGGIAAVIKGLFG